MRAPAQRDGLFALAGALMVHGVVAAFVLAPEPAPEAGGGIGLVSVSLGQSGAPSSTSAGSVEARPLVGSQPEPGRPELDLAEVVPPAEMAEEPVVLNELVTGPDKSEPAVAETEVTATPEPMFEKAEEVIELPETDNTQSVASVLKLEQDPLEVEVAEVVMEADVAVDVVEIPALQPVAPPLEEPEELLEPEVTETVPETAEVEAQSNVAPVAVPPVPLLKPDVPEATFDGADDALEEGMELAQTQAQTGVDGPTDLAQEGEGDDGLTGRERDGGESDASSSGSGEPNQQAIDYFVILQNWLERHKDYPRSAMVRGEEGVVLLYFVIGRDGLVQEHRIHQSSGHEVLDREVLAMIERAQPLPRIPDSLGYAHLELVIPIAFNLH